MIGIGHASNRRELIAHIFAQIDLEGTGRLPIDEVRAALERDPSLTKLLSSNGQLPPSAEELLEAIDTDGDGSISLAEMQSYCAHGLDPICVRIRRSVARRVLLTKQRLLGSSKGAAEFASRQAAHISKATLDVGVSTAETLGSKTTELVTRMNPMKLRRHLKRASTVVLAVGAGATSGDAGATAADAPAKEAAQPLSTADAPAAIGGASSVAQR